MAIKSPCKGCTERYVGCHGKCKKYIVFREKVDEQNDNREKLNSYINGYRREKKARLDKIAHNKRSS